MKISKSKNYKHNLVKLFTLLSLVTFEIQAEPAKIPQGNGITLQSTRLIYPESQKKGITFKVANNAKTPYLVQSRVAFFSQYQSKEHTEQQKKQAPFIVLPPLKKLDVHEELSLVIRRTKNSELPSDRESVFAFQIKTIPEQSHNTSHIAEMQSSTTQITLALQNTMKLFYRPNGLPQYDAEKIASSLSFVLDEKQLVVSNPTPFYITFKNLSVGKTEVEAAELFQMIPPFEPRAFPISPLAQGEVRWQLITDYGSATKAYSRSLVQ